MEAQDTVVIQDRVEKLNREAETLRKAGTWTGIASIAGTIGAGLIFPPAAVAIGVLATGAAATMLYWKISDQQKLAKLTGRERNQDR